MKKVNGLKKGLSGTLVLPGDKSISHRALMLGSLATGVTKIKGFLAGKDCLNTVKNFQYMGVPITINGDKATIKGVGLNGLQKPSRALDVGNSGTAFRLMLGILAGQKFITKLNGDRSLQGRPMKRVVDPLKKMGGKFSGDVAPIIIFPSAAGLRKFEYKLPVASAQVKSAILLAGLYATGDVAVIDDFNTRDHTERMLEVFGVKLNKSKTTGKITLPKSADRNFKGQEISVPVDISSAAFFIVAALIVPGSKLTLKNIGINPTRTGILDALLKMNAKITIKNKKIVSAEPVADLVVEYSSLKGATFSGDIIVKMIDEIPVLAVTAAFAQGQTIIKDAAELRVKESDRIKSICEMLGKFGVKYTERKDGLEVFGDPDRVIAKKTTVSSQHDHRIAMASLILGLRNSKETVVTDTNCIDTSFPGFMEYLKKIM